MFDVLMTNLAAIGSIIGGVVGLQCLAVAHKARIGESLQILGNVAIGAVVYGVAVLLLHALPHIMAALLPDLIPGFHQWNQDHTMRGV